MWHFHVFMIKDFLLLVFFHKMCYINKIALQQILKVWPFLLSVTVVTSVISENNNKLKDLNNTLSSENERLRRDNDNQTVIIVNLTKEYNVSEMKIKKLTAENQQLKTEKNKLTEQIQNIENTVVQQNFDAYNTIKDGSKFRSHNSSLKVTNDNAVILFICWFL